MSFLPVTEGLPILNPALSKFTVNEVMQYVAAFVTAASNLSEPTRCPYCFAVIVFDLANNSAALNALQRDAYVFWETCLRLIVQYTQEDIARLRKRLRDNQLACKNRSVYHKYKLPLTTPDTFEIFINALLFAISTGLTIGKRPAHGNGGLAKFRNRKGYWPRDLYDLFPVDVERVVDGLVHWVCVPSTAFPFSVLSHYLQIARAVVFPVLMAQPRRDRLLLALLQLITPDQPTVPWDGAAPFAIPAGLCVPQMLRRDEKLCDAALYTLRVVRFDVHARTGDDALFVAGREALFLDALERLDLARPVAPDMLAQFVRETRFYTTRDYICALRALLGHPLDACHPAAHHEPCPAATIHRFFVRLDSSYCFNPGCMSAELQDYEMRAFRQCAQCRVARYCSVECQKKDWSKNEPKHKVLCGSIAELGPCVAESRAREDDFVAWFDQTVEYTPELVAMLLQWTAACGLIPRSYVPVKVED